MSIHWEQSKQSLDKFTHQELSLPCLQSKEADVCLTNEGKTFQTLDAIENPLGIYIAIMLQHPYRNSVIGKNMFSTNAVIPRH
jgi:hypothetical protein